MKLVKPLKLGLLHRVFQNAGQPVLSLTAMAFFPFGQPRRLLPEVPMWTSAQEALGPELPLDLAMPKSRGELLVAGNAYVLGGNPGPATNVVVELGPIKKELYVIGDRLWEATGPSAPVPFTSMPVSWSRAFGGPSFKHNTQGKGAEPVERDGRKFHPLPNVEHKKQLVKGPSDQPDPVGLGPMDQTWPVRARHVGTYDDAWLKTRFPWFPEDFHWEFFNVAPEDQRLPSFFAGGETFRVEGMHPERRVVEGEVPQLAARFFVRRRGSDALVAAPPARLDTLLLLPNIERGIAIYRTTLNVESDDAHEISHLVAAFEDPNAPRPLSHYVQVLEKREDKRLAALHLLRDEDLCPPQEGVQEKDDDWNDLMSLHEPKGYALDRLLKKFEAQREELKAELLERGLDPAEVDAKVVAPKLPPREPAALAAYLEAHLSELEVVQKDLDARLAKSLDEARAHCEARGVDFDSLLEDAKNSGGGPPKFKAQEELDRLEARLSSGRSANYDTSDLEKKLADPTLRGQLEALEQQFLASYRAFAHFFPEAPTPGGDEATIKRLLAEQAVGGGSLAGVDLTRADLRGLDLSGVDLTEALLEGALLEGARFERANLTGAVLARVSAPGVNFRGAKLGGANLGKADLSGASFDGAELQRVTLFETNLGGASLQGADLTGLTTLGSRFDGADFSSTGMTSLIFYEQSLRGAKLSHADLTQTVFSKCDLTGADFSGAKLVRTGIVECPCDDAVFLKAELDRTVFALGTSLERCDFKGSKMKHASFRGAPLRAADLSGAHADDCDFSEADLSGGKLYRCSLQRSLFVRTNLRGADVKSSNLTNAILDKAQLHGADLRSTNLFRASLAKVRGDRATRLEDAYLKQILVVPEQDNQERLTLGEPAK